MAITTLFRDDMDKCIREAWQEGVVVFTWTRKEIDVMYAESPTVPEFGHFKGSVPIHSFAHNG